MSSNAFSAADMTTAAASGHRDGYQAGYADAVKAFDAAQPAAAQEVVVWMAEPVMQSTRSRSRVFCSDKQLAMQWDYSGHPDYGRMIVTPLYAAPVAAAPACPGCSSPLLYECIACSVSNYPNTSDSPVDTWFADQLTAMGEVIPLASTPAASGIDLDQFRESVIQEAARAVELWMKDGISNEAYAESKAKRDRLLALIDDSPKGGSDAWQPMDAAPKSVADGERVEGIYLLGFIHDADLVDPQAGIDVIWWEPLLPNSKGGRGKWCANRFGEECEVVPTKWQHLPEVQATSAEVGA